MTEKEETILNVIKVIKDIILFVSLTWVMFDARDLMQAVQSGFLLVAIMIINKK